MKQYIVDAFTDKIFSGNQAAICVMSSWPCEKLMMNIARENNFSETAFIVKESGGKYHLRWFTPEAEIDLCGHATLASAYMEIEANSLGLGVLYSGFFVACTYLNPRIKAMLKLPRGHKAVTCMIIGYPDVKYKRITPRRPLKINKL